MSVSELLHSIGSALEARGLTLATAESCTGGLVGKTLTDIPGSSRFYKGGVVAYSDELKVSLLGVDPDIIRAHGAVSAQVALRMAEGVRRAASADLGISCTGVAGPGGGTMAKPVGTVCLAVSGPGMGRLETLRFPGGRESVRAASTLRLLEMLMECLEGA